jgi:Carbamoyltransferase N-terminus
MKFYEDFDFFRLVKLIDEQGNEAKLMTGKGEESRFLLLPGRIYQLSVFQRALFSSPLRSAVERKRDLVLSGVSDDIVSVRPIQHIVGKYDLLNFAFKTSPISQKKDNFLILDVKYENPLDPHLPPIPPVQIPVHITPLKLQKVVRIFSVIFFLIRSLSTIFYRSFPFAISGKTMALSIFGDSKRFEGVELFEMREGQLISLMQNDPLNPVKMVQQFAKNTDVDFGTPRSSDEPLEDMHKDIAYFVQDRMERALLEKITLLSHQTGIKKLCLAGGVALNCVVNTKILKSTPIEKLFVVPAAGDTGQCLGNALYGHSIILGQQQRPEGFSPFLGRVYTNYKKTVDKWLQ